MIPSELSTSTSSNIVTSAVAAKKGTSRCTRLNLGSYFADIVSDKSSAPPAVYWIVQRVGSAEVLGIGHEPAFAGALEQAHGCLQRLVKRSRSRAKPRAVFYEFGAGKMR